MPEMLFSNELYMNRFDSS